MPDYRYYVPPESLFHRPTRSATLPAAPTLPSDIPVAPTVRKPASTVGEMEAKNQPDILSSLLQTVRVILADDHCAVREGIAHVLAAKRYDGTEVETNQPNIQVVGQAGTSTEALTLARQHQPEVVVLDLSMPGNWQLTMQTIRRECRHTNVMALTMHEDMAYVRSVFQAGGTGYVLKRSAADRLLQAISVVAAGESYVDPALSGQVASQMTKMATKKGGDGAVTESDIAEATIIGMLSDREEEVLRLVARGFTNKEIAARIFLGVKTVETYKARGIQKLGFSSRADVMRYALRNGWLND